jgi:hypothetical protein
MRKLVVGLIVALLLFAPAIRSLGQSLQLFQTEVVARTHCPADVVVWLNLPSGIYHFKGMRWYGNTLHGAYVCKAEADAAGDRVPAAVPLE